MQAKQLTQLLLSKASSKTSYSYLHKAKVGCSDADIRQDINWAYYYVDRGRGGVDQSGQGEIERERRRAG